MIASPSLKSIVLGLIPTLYGDQPKDISDRKLCQKYTTLSDLDKRELCHAATSKN